MKRKLIVTFAFIAFIVTIFIICTASTNEDYVRKDCTVMLYTYSGEYLETYSGVTVTYTGDHYIKFKTRSNRKYISNLPYIIKQ